MFNYTRTALNKIGSDIKKLMLIINASIILGSIAYLVHSLVSETGNVYANTALCTLTVMYFIFFVLKTRKVIKKNEFKNFKRIYRIMKLSVNALVLILAIYGIISGLGSSASIIKTYLLLALWLIQAIFEILVFVIEMIANMFVSAIGHDAFWLAKFLNKNATRPSNNDPYIRKLEPFVESARKEATEKRASEKREKIQDFKDKIESIFVTK